MPILLVDGVIVRRAREVQSVEVPGPSLHDRNLVGQEVALRLRALVLGAPFHDRAEWLQGRLLRLILEDPARVRLASLESLVQVCVPFKLAIDHHFRFERAFIAYSERPDYVAVILCGLLGLPLSVAVGLGACWTFELDLAERLDCPLSCDLLALSQLANFIVCSVDGGADIEAQSRVPLVVVIGRVLRFHDGDVRFDQQLVHRVSLGLGPVGCGLVTRLREQTFDCACVRCDAEGALRLIAASRLGQGGVHTCGRNLHSPTVVLVLYFGLLVLLVVCGDSHDVQVDLLRILVLV